MYPTFSLLNHNCVCNTRTRKFLQDGNNIIELEAMVIIKKGEEICTRYVAHLAKSCNILFDCKCPLTVLYLTQEYVMIIMFYLLEIPKLAKILIIL